MLTPLLIFFFRMFFKVLPRFLESCCYSQAFINPAIDNNSASSDEAWRLLPVILATTNRNMNTFSSWHLHTFVW